MPAPNDALATRAAGWRRDPGAFPPLLVAVATGLALTLYLFWPGFLTWDSLVQLRQARSGVIENAHPPIMAHLWRITDRWLPGPAGMLLFHASAYWSGLALLSTLVSRSGSVRLAWTLCIGCFPPTFWLLPTVWKDNGFVACALLCAGLTFAELPGRRLRLALALPFAFYACAVRTPGWFAVLPLLFAIAGSFTPAPAPVLGATPQERWRARRPALLLASGLALLFAAGNVAIDRIGVVRLPYRAAVPLWDLAQISLAKGRLMIPAFAIQREGFDLRRLKWIADPLRANFHATEDGRWTATRDLDYRLLDDREADALIRHWLRVAWNNPREYFQHRRRVTRGLFVDPIAKSMHQIQSFPDFSTGARFVHRPGYNRLWVLVRGLQRGLLYEPWVYVLLGAAVVVASAGVRGSGARSARLLALSGLISVAPLPIIAPSTDFRYSIWCIETALLGAVLLGSSIRRDGLRWRARSESASARPLC